MTSSIQTKNLKEFEGKCIRGERWENEYGCLHAEKFKKEYYSDSSQCKVNVHEENNVMYFKIVPKYYKIPCGHYYWSYCDGCVHENHIEWRRIPVK